MGTKRVFKPIWGFGWVGWTGLAVVIALVLVLVTGYDLRFQLQGFILSLFGWDAMMWATVSIHYYQIASLGPGPGFVPLVLAMLAVQLCSRRIYKVPFALSVVIPVISPAITALLGYLRYEFDIDAISFRYLWEFGDVFWMTCFAAALVLATRSWLIAAGSAFGIPASYAGGILLDGWFLTADSDSLSGSVLATLFATPIEPASFLLWIPFGVSIGLWAWLDRRQYTHSKVCNNCGYSRAGLAEVAACPECGFTPNPSPPPAPPPRAPAP